MTLLSPQTEKWQLLTLTNIRLRRLWGWGHSIQKILAASDPAPRACGKLLVASDYGGNQRESTHLIYCYFVVRGEASGFLAAMRKLRRNQLNSGRRMSYKRLDDAARQRALAPFLMAAANLDGHLVSIAVDKKKQWLSLVREAAEDFRCALRLKVSWKAPAFEAMIRKVHFVSILLSLWSRPYTDLTWITDQDEFVANDDRHDDALQAAARMSSFYVPHPMGVLRLNTTGQRSGDSDYEDLCAIPDLAAGMLSEISTRLTHAGSWENRIDKAFEDNLSIKAGLLADWFWDSNMPLRKTLISIDAEESGFTVRKITMRTPTLC